MGRLRRLGIGALAALCCACAHSNYTVQRDGGARLSEFHRIGVLPLKDPKGQGDPIAQGIQDGLQKLLFEPPDVAALKRLAVEYKLEPNSGMRLEAVETIRDQASADAIILGVMAPDWSAASLVIAEMEMGQPVMRVVVTPRDPKKKAFTSAGEVAQEAVRALASLR